MRVLKGLFFSIVIAIALAGCGRKYEVQGFEAYVDKFRAIGAVEGKTVKFNDLVVEFGQVATASADAQCVQGGGSPHIVIRKESWDAASELRREATLFHEMGHCILNRTHLSEMMDAQCPKSMMYPTTLSDTCYQQNLETYYQELFK